MARAPITVVPHPQFRGYYVTLRAHEVRGFTVPAGFVCDFASIPKPVRWLFGEPAEGPNRDAGLLHDYLYATRRVSRAQADELFRRQLVDDGMAPWKASIMHRAVRLFGASHYDGWWTKEMQLATDWVTERPLRMMQLAHSHGLSVEVSDYHSV